jgi:hypothetical protein
MELHGKVDLFAFFSSLILISLFFVQIFSKDKGYSITRYVNNKRQNCAELRPNSTNGYANTLRTQYTYK